MTDDDVLFFPDTAPLFTKCLQHGLCAKKKKTTNQGNVPEFSPASSIKRPHSVLLLRSKQRSFNISDWRFDEYLLILLGLIYSV